MCQEITYSHIWGLSCILITEAASTGLPTQLRALSNSRNGCNRAKHIATEGHAQELASFTADSSASFDSARRDCILNPSSRSVQNIEPQTVGRARFHFELAFCRRASARVTFAADPRSESTLDGASSCAADCRRFQHRRHRCAPLTRSRTQQRSTERFQYTETRRSKRQNPAPASATRDPLRILRRIDTEQ